MKRGRSQWAGGRERARAGTIIRCGGSGLRPVAFCPSGRLKCRAAPYRPAATKGNPRVPVLPPIPGRQLGRSQAVRQRILIPPFGGSIPPAPARCSASPEIPHETGLAGELLHSSATHHCCTGVVIPWLRIFSGGMLWAPPSTAAACQFLFLSASFSELEDDQPRDGAAPGRSTRPDPGRCSDAR